MKRNIFIMLLAVLVMLPLLADLPDDPITFPEDDYGHQDNPLNFPLGVYAEWWYFNGELKGTVANSGEERNLGFFLSLHQHKFPFFTEDSKQVLSAVSDLDNEEYYFTYFNNHQEDFSVDIVSTDSFHIQYEGAESDSRAKLKGFKTDPQNPDKTTMKLNSKMTTATGVSVTLDLVLQPLNNPLLVNGGKIDMPGTFYGFPNGESVYIAKTKLLVSGKIIVGNETIFIDPAESEGWFDHQYGDFLGSDTTGWEWFAVRLNTDDTPGYDMYGTIYSFVDINTKEFLFGHSSFILPDGSVRHIDINSPLEFVKSDFLDAPMGYTFPLTHNITLPELDLSLEISSSFARQYNQNMYEGHCGVTASYGEKAVTGFAYKELVY